MSKEIQIFKPEMEEKIGEIKIAQTLLQVYETYLESEQVDAAEQLLVAVDQLLMGLDLEILFPIGNAITKSFIDEMDAIAKESGYAEYDFIDYFLVGGLTH